MMNSTAIRLYVVAAVLLATYGVAKFVSGSIKPPDVEMPHWTFNEMPMQLGGWNGESTTLDPEIAAATGASIIVDRVYHAPAGQAILMHTAMFKNPADGVFHTPINCYRSNGYQDLSLTTENLKLSDSVTLPVHLSKWERTEGKNEKLLVVYWYQLGEYVLFDRMDMGLKVRWGLRGRPKWPALIKVMLQLGYTADENEAKATLLGFAEQVATWENQPKHGLLLREEATPSVPEKSAPKK